MKDGSKNASQFSALLEFILLRITRKTLDLYKMEFGLLVLEIFQGILYKNIHLLSNYKRIFVLKIYINSSKIRAMKQIRYEFDKDKLCTRRHFKI